MKLFAALGAALVFTKGPVPENAAAWSNVLEIADRLGDAEFQLRALWGFVGLSHHRASIGPRWRSPRGSTKLQKPMQTLPICPSAIGSSDTLACGYQRTADD